MWPPLVEVGLRARLADRRARAGGARPDDRDPHRYAHCDVWSWAAGPAGPARRSGGRGSGARVILVERQAELGGSLQSESGTLALFLMRRLAMHG